MNVIEFRLCDEDRARLDDIICGLAALLRRGGEMSDAAAPEIPVEGDAQFQLVATPTPFDEAPAPDPEPPAKIIPLPEFQKAIVTKCAVSPAMKAGVQALVHKYADSVSAIPEAKRAEVLAELDKL